MIRKYPIKRSRQKPAMIKLNKLKGMTPNLTQRKQSNQMKNLSLRRPLLKVKLIKKVLLGGAIVDDFVPQKEKYHVLVENGTIYDCTMNQTNIVGGSNNNKFYMV